MQFPYSIYFFWKSGSGSWIKRWAESWENLEKWRDQEARGNRKEEEPVLMKGTSNSQDA